MLDAATMGSTFMCGIASWPPRPVMLIAKLSAPAIIVPTRVATKPVGMKGAT